MTRKPDRFERMVEKTLQQYQEFDDFLTDNGLLKEADVLNLLRREHRAVVRMVKKEYLGTVGRSERCEGWNQAIECILELLKTRAS